MKSHVRLTSNFIKSFIYWVARSQLFWFALFILVGVPAAAWVYSPGEDALRYAGLIQQIFGIAAVFWGIRDTRKQFGHPSFWAQALALFEQRPSYRPKPISVSGNVTLPSLCVTGYARTWHQAPNEPTLEERIAAAEKNLLTLTGELSALRRNNDDNSRQQKAELDNERRAREAENSEIHEKIRLAETGGLTLSAVGAFWLLSGVIFATIPAELSKLLTWLGFGIT